MLKILEKVQSLEKKEKRRPKQVFLLPELEAAMQKELDKRDLSWQTVLEASCLAFLEECRTDKKKTAG